MNHIAQVWLSAGGNSASVGLSGPVALVIFIVVIIVVIGAVIRRRR
jgi:hypothetical protein